MVLCPFGTLLANIPKWGFRVPRPLVLDTYRFWGLRALAREMTQMSNFGHLGFRTCQGPDQVLSKSAQNVSILGPLFGGPKWGPEWVHFRALKWSIFGPLAGDP